MYTVDQPFPVVPVPHPPTSAASLFDGTVGVWGGEAGSVVDVGDMGIYSVYGRV